MGKNEKKVICTTKTNRHGQVLNKQRSGLAICEHILNIEFIPNEFRFEIEFVVYFIYECTRIWSIVFLVGKSSFEIVGRATKAEEKLSEKFMRSYRQRRIFPFLSISDAIY